MQLVFLTLWTCSFKHISARLPKWCEAQTYMNHAHALVCSAISCSSCERVHVNSPCQPVLESKDLLVHLNIPPSIYLLKYVSWLCKRTSAYKHDSMSTSCLVLAGEDISTLMQETVTQVCSSAVTLHCCEKFWSINLLHGSHSILSNSIQDSVFHFLCLDYPLSSSFFCHRHMFLIPVAEISAH